MDKQQLFGKVWGDGASWFDRLILGVHIGSVPFTALGFYADWVTPLQAIGLGAIIVATLCLFPSLLIQLIAKALESVISKTLVRWSFFGFGSVIMFVLALGFLGMVIWTNHQTSQRGRIYGVDVLIDDPAFVQNGTADSIKASKSAIALSEYNRRKHQIDSTLRAEKANHQRQFENITINIGNPPRPYLLPAARKKAKSVRFSHPQWSQGIYTNVSKAETKGLIKKDQQDTESEAKAAAATAVIDSIYNAALVPINEEYAAANASYLEIENNRVDKAKEAKALVMDAGKWWVIVTAFGSFILSLLKEGYRRWAGLDLIGEVYDPTKKDEESIVQQVKEIFTTQRKSVASRLKKSNEELAVSAGNKGAYRLPPTRYFVGSIVFAFAAFAITQTSFFSFSEQQQMMFVPAPYSYLMLFVALYALGAFLHHEYKRDKKTTSGSAAKPVSGTVSKTVSTPPTPATPKPTSPPPAKTKPKTKPTVEEVSISCLNSDRSALLFELDGKKYNSTQMQDKIRKYYERSKTSKRQKTKDKNEAIYTQLKQETSPYFVFSESSNSVSVNLK